MILVTGTKRSGTSMWMQILVAAGFRHVGKPFPSVWEESIKAANPRGFYESKLRNGVYYKTNPNPKSGYFVPPRPTRAHALKVFIPGLCRTDLAYIDRVIASVRNWREYGASLDRLSGMEDSYLASETVRRRSEDPGFTRDLVAEARTRRTQLPKAVDWWFENYDLIRDVATRRYPFHLVTYDAVLADPEKEIGRVLRWLKKGDLAAACAVVEDALRTQRADPKTLAVDPAIDDELAAVFDAFYDAVNRLGTLTPELLKLLNETQAKLRDRWDAPSRERTVAREVDADS